MAQQQSRRRKRDEEEPEEQVEELDEDPQDAADSNGEVDNEVGLRLKGDMVEIDLPRDGNEGRTLHAIADMLDAMAA